MSQDDEIAIFYDEHPYPPPIDALDSVAQAWSDGRRARVEHFRHWPSLPERDRRDILVAGCGTFQAASWGLRYPRATIVGIDVSPTSLQATDRLLRRHRIGNVTLEHLPIERVDELGRSFDQIVCTGVLHHLEDPVRGLRALRSVLTDDGAMNLMVYAAYGRHGIAMLQDYCRRIGVQPDRAGLDDLMTTLRELPLGHPMSHLLRDSPDFRTADAVADALLNPRERSYTVPELLDFLAASGIRFGRWVRQAPYLPTCGVMRELPHGPQLASMAEPDQFAAMELFRGTMTRHSFIAHRDDSPLPVAPVSWEGSAWQGYVPVVPTSVVVVRDRLPPGMAGAVINRSHIDRDLVCFLRPAELSVFEAIDGTTPLREIPGATPEFMARVWQHDLVVIDASASGSERDPPPP